MTKMMSTIILVTAVAIVSMKCNRDTVAPYTSGGGTPAKSSPNTITMSGMAFGPTTLTVAKGTVVTWQNNDGVPHTSTSDTGIWDTGNIPPGGTQTTTFNTSGTFSYHCTVHPMMTGTITVQ